MDLELNQNQVLPPPGLAFDPGGAFPFFNPPLA